MPITGRIPRVGDGVFFRCALGGAGRFSGDPSGNPASSAVRLVRLMEANLAWSLSLWKRECQYAVCVSGLVYFPMVSKSNERKQTVSSEIQDNGLRALNSLQHSFLLTFPNELVPIHT